MPAVRRFVNTERREAGVLILASRLALRGAHHEFSS
jgi:hypothetical protein